MQNLPKLLDSLKHQTIDASAFEIILVNDHSTDQWESTINAIMPLNARILHSPDEGKKAVLRWGVQHAKGEVIAMTDADCIIPQRWIEILLKQFENKQHTVAIGAVRLTSDDSFFQYFQQLDFLSLQVSAMGSVGLNHPMLCNGANLACRKDFYNSIKSLNDNYLSGDDVFLLHEAKRRGVTISMVNDTDAVVETQPVGTLKALLNQRIRWASKSKGYTDFDTLAVAWIVFLANAGLVTLFAAGWWSLTGFMIWLIVFLIKATIDKLLFDTGFQFFAIQHRPFYYILAQLIHPFYTVAIVFAAAFTNGSWKGRRQ
jgi:cellulose synthase/poly-beta-1,6-N-acetylglucosamine synthase-like glycosyltransferase